MRQRNAPKALTEPQPTKFSFVSSFKALDVVNPKVEQSVEEQYTTKTALGASFSIVVYIIMLFLFISELRSYLTVQTKEHIGVDLSAETRMGIYFNFSFPHLQCSQTNMDVVDRSGDQQLHVFQNIFKQRLNALGQPIGGPFEERQQADFVADEPGEGCGTWGILNVSRLAGNFHIALGASREINVAQHVHNFRYSDARTYNASHTVHHLSFGKSVPGVTKHPLDGVIKGGLDPEGVPQVSHFKYFLSVVPTTYVDMKGNLIATNQFSVTEHVHFVTRFDSSMTANTIPGVFFVYDMAPYLVTVTETSMPFSRFVTSVCAIIGGVYTVAGVIASVLHHAVLRPKSGGL